MAKQNIAAGLLMCRVENEAIEYFLVHPGGPFFKNKHDGVWTIPKGIPESGESDLLSVAVREFEEETSIKPKPPFHPIGCVQQKAGKVVHAWTFLGDWNPKDGITSNTFSLEWPPKSGKLQSFPEIDKATWMTYDEAIIKINPAQVDLLDRAKRIILK